jgi:hypothetical protein
LDINAYNLAKYVADVLDHVSGTDEHTRLLVQLKQKLQPRYLGSEAIRAALEACRKIQISLGEHLGEIPDELTFLSITDQLIAVTLRKYRLSDLTGTDELGQDLRNLLKANFRTFVSNL